MNWSDLTGFIGELLSSITGPSGDRRRLRAQEREQAQFDRLGEERWKERQTRRLARSDWWAGTVEEPWFWLAIVGSLISITLAIVVLSV